MGVMSGGRQAAFALLTGVGHTGPGRCRPDHAHCSAIVLEAGQTEKIAVPIAAPTAAPTAVAGHRELLLRLVRITKRVTHSRQVALAAYARYSAAGQCELDLTDRLSYSQSDGTLSRVAAAACSQHPAAVPFPDGVGVR
jgi:hypothetical protein